MNGKVLFGTDSPLLLLTPLGFCGCEYALEESSVQR
jgi:hypothetical protein